MSEGNGRAVLRLDDYYAADIVIEFRGKDHVLPGETLTADVVFGLQNAMLEAARLARELDGQVEDVDPEPLLDAQDRVRDRVEAIIATARPKLALGDTPAASLIRLAGFILASAGVTSDPPPPPNRAARRTPAGTRATKR